MYRVIRSITVVGCAFAAAACSESPVQSVTDAEFVSSDAAARAATSQIDLQQALDEADGGVIRIAGEIVLTEPLTYDGEADLVLQGSRNARIVGPLAPITEAPSNSGARVGEETSSDGLQMLSAANLTIRNLTFAGQGGHGIYLELPGDAQGTVRVDMANTHFEGQGLSGMWIEDQAGGSELDPITIESDASIHLDLRNVSVTGTGFAEDDEQSCRELAEGFGCSFADFDGFRINEGGEGDITFDFRNVRFTGNAGDGIEFDEIGAGEVLGSVNGSDFSGNGEQPQFPEDLEDGFDIDEAGPGGIHLVMRGTTVNDNIDEGIDLDESDLDEFGDDVVGPGVGDVYFEARGVVATGNADENIKISDFVEVVTFDEATGEEIEALTEVLGGAGDIVLAISDVVADGSAEGRGARFEEFGEGDVLGYIRDSSFSDNTEDDGLRIDEEEAGSIDIELTGIVASGNDGQGLQLTENGEGDIAARISDSSFLENGNTAVEAEEEDGGIVALDIIDSLLIGADGEESLQVDEDGDGGTVNVVGGTVDPAPDVSIGVTVIITP